MQPINHLLTLAVGCCVATSVSAATVTHYTRAETNSGVTFQNRGQGFYDGRASSVAASGTRTINGANLLVNEGYQQRVTTSELASADLSTGKLRGLASVAVAETTGSPPQQTGDGYSYSSSSYSVLADTFDVVGDDDSPFAWSPNTNFTFSMAINGSTDLASGLLVPSGSTRGSYAEAGLSFRAYKVGTMDLMAQQDRLWATVNQPGVLDRIRALSQQIETNKVANKFWVLGDYNVPASWLPSYAAYAVDISQGDVTLTYSFQPGGAFEWMATLSLSSKLEEGLTDVSSTLDFSHTVSLGFTAPAGATVLSASGLFPQTQALVPANGVPAPSPASLLLLPLACLALRTASQRRNAVGKN